jgi:hypothetical protein
MGAAKDKTACTTTIISQVWSVASLAIDIISLGTAGGATSATSNALQQAFQRMKEIYQEAKPAINALITAYKGAKSASDLQMWMESGGATDEDKARLAAEVIGTIGMMDPTGITSSAAGVVQGYTYPKCSKYFGNYLPK